jgi:hypothetical protein
MTELMKRYEAETGKKARDELYSGSIRLYMPTNDYIAWLEAQLTHQPVSKPPKEGQIVFAMISTGWVVAQYFKGEFYIDDGFTYGYRIEGVVKWFPIPPAPEGE